MLALVLCVMLCPAALAQSMNGRNLFTLQIPKDWQDYGAESSEDVEGEYYDLGFAGGPGARDLNVGLSLYAYPEYADLRLFDAGNEEIEDFTDVMIRDFGGTKFVATRRVSEYDIPFSVFYCQDGQDEYICAATLANGWVIVIMGYAYANGKYEDLRSLNGEDVSQFMKILDSFEPILKGNKE